MVIDENCKF